MILIKFGTGRGINAERLVEWYDCPEGDEPYLTLVMAVSSEHESGQQQPYTIQLAGDERTQVLRWLGTTARTSFHLGRATQTDDETDED